MGRKSWSNRKTVEECRTLRVAGLVKAGLFKVGATSPLRYRQDTWRNAGGQEVAIIKYGSVNEPHGGLAIWFNYSGNQRELEGDVGITSIPSPLAQGKRYFFLCPVIRNGIPCRRRVGKLYLETMKTIEIRDGLRQVQNDATNGDHHVGTQLQESLTQSRDLDSGAGRAGQAQAQFLHQYVSRCRHRDAKLVGAG